MGEEVLMEEGKEYFFSDVNGKQITVKAKNKEEAEQKAKVIK